MRTISSSSRLPAHTFVLGTATLVLLSGDAGRGAAAQMASASHERHASVGDPIVEPDLAAQSRVRERYGQLPLSFEANHGQSDSTVRFLSRGKGYSLFLTSNQAILVLSQSGADTRGNASQVARPAIRAGHRTSVALRMTLVNANPQSKVTGHEALPGRSHYFIGSDPAKWRTNIATYARVQYEGVYPGVDLIYYGHQGQLEYDFVVAPGADPDVVTLAFEGARDVRIDARGELVLGVEGGEVRQHKPVVYQKEAGGKREVAGRYVMKGTGRVGFQVAAYDPARPLIIDPVLVYSTYLGGSGAAGGEGGEGIAVDAAGHAYVTGGAVSVDFPTTAGAFQTAPAGGNDAFVAKLDASGSELVFSTYLGGSGSDTGNGIAVDAAGRAYVTGITDSTDFPTTAGAAQTTNAGGFGDAFVTKLDATGSRLVYSTYLGGSDRDGGNGIAVDAEGRGAYVTGETGQAADFPTTAGAFQTAPAGSNDAFVTKLNATGSGLVYSTYLGGGAADFVLDIAVDAAGSAYVTGGTTGDFPTTAGAAQTTYAGGTFDALVTKLNPTGTGLVFSTYLGGGGETGSDIAFGIAVDSAGSAYVVGRTGATDFPTTAGAAQTMYAGLSDAFVTKLDATGSGLVFSTYLGGSRGEFSGDIAVDGARRASVTGRTQSPDFPTTAGAPQPTHAQDFDAFVTMLDAAGSRRVFSTYLGGLDADSGNGIAVDSVGSAYVTGATLSRDFPTTAGAPQTTLAGFSDAFVAKIAVAATSIAQADIPLVIDRPGRYIVTEDLVVAPGGRAILILADRVELDLNGFTISGPLDGPSTCGSLPPTRAVSAGIQVGRMSDELFFFVGGHIRNGTIRGVDYGIVLLQTLAHVVSDVTVAETCQCGVRLGASHANAIQENVVSLNFRSGVCVDRSHANRVHGNRLNDNSVPLFAEDEEAGHGLLMTDSHLNVVSSNSVVGNGGGDIKRSNGIVIVRSNANTIVDNRSNRNDFVGLYLIDSSNNTIHRNNIDSGGEISLLLTGVSHGNLVQRNQANGGAVGIVADSSGGGNRFLRNTALNNQVDVWEVNPTIPCVNLWRNNTFGTAHGNVGCIR